MKVFETIEEALKFIWKFPLGTCGLTSKGDGSGFVVTFLTHSLKWIAVVALFNKFV